MSKKDEVKIELGNSVQLQPVKDMEAGGKEVTSMNVHMGGVEKFCGFQQAIAIPSMIEGGKPTLLRPPCNSRCANFSTGSFKNAKGDEFQGVKLSCGSGAIYPIVGVVEPRAERKEPILRTIE